MRFLSALLLSVCLVVAHGAPIPTQKPKQKPEFTPVGAWNLRWNSCDYLTNFIKDGSYSSGGLWFGSWTYDPKTRTLSVSESGDNGMTFMMWSVKLSEDLKGTAIIQGKNITIDVQLEKPKPQQLGPIL